MAIGKKISLVLFQAVREKHLKCLRVGGARLPGVSFNIEIGSLGLGGRLL